MKKISKAILLSIVALLIASLPVLAAVAYRATYTIIESGGTSYTMLPVLEEADNKWMADNGFMELDALDTRIETLGGLEKPHMVADNKTLTAVIVPANSQTNLYFTTANTDLSSMDTITGLDGYITIDDDATLELGSDFEIEQKGYVDTDAGANKNLVYKEDAYKTYIESATEITSVIFETATSVDYDPTANGTLNENTLVGPTRWEAMSDNSDATTLSMTNATYKTDRFVNPTIYTDKNRLDVVSAVEVFWRAQEAGDGPRGRAVLFINSSQYEGDIEDYAAGWAWFSFEWTQNPDTVADWTVEDLNGIEFGFTQNEVGAGTPDAITSESYIKVSYIPTVDVTATGISSGEHTVKTYGVDNEPVWATGNVLDFDGASGMITVTDDAAIQDIFDGGGTIEFWLNANSDGEGNLARIVNKGFWDIFLSAEVGGQVKVRLVYAFSVSNSLWITTSREVDLNVWTHIAITYDADNVVNVPIIYVNGSPVTLSETAPVGVRTTDVGTDLKIGNRADDSKTFDGILSEVRLYSSILGATTITDHFEGDYSDRTNLIGEWYIDEGTGTAVSDYSGNNNTGTITGATWETSTYTTGSTGRLTDFYIEVDSNRWGKNLKGASVPDNGNNWLLNQNNVMPYMDYYKHTVSGVQHAWYQPNYMVEATDSSGTETAGGSATLITAGEITEAIDYWVGGLVTITGAGGAAPEDEARVVTSSTVGTLTVSPAFSANVDIGDTFTVDFGTLIDRSYYNLHFDGTATSNINAGAIHNASAKLWVSLWFRLDSTFSAASGTDQFIWGKRLDGNNYEALRFSSGNGGLRFYKHIAGPEVFSIFARNGGGLITSWGGGRWYHVLISTSSANGVRFIIDNGTVETDGDVTPLPNGGLFSIGDVDDPGFGTGFVGEIQNVIVGTDDLTTDEEAALYAGTAPGDEINYWYIDEGTSTNIVDYGSGGNNGTRDTNAAWQTSTDIFGSAPYPHNAPGVSGTNDSRVTWGVNPTGVAVTLGGMVSEGQPVPGVELEAESRDIMPPIEVSDWYVEPDVGGSLSTNPLRPFVTMMSDNRNISELLVWRLYGSALLLMITVATAYAVRSHQGITMMMAGATMLGLVVLTIYPMWALVLVTIMFMGGLAMERSQSL